MKKCIEKYLVLDFPNENPTMDEVRSALIELRKDFAQKLAISPNDKLAHIWAEIISHSTAAIDKIDCGKELSIKNWDDDATT